MASASSVLIPTIWAREALTFLRENFLMAALVHRDFEDALSLAGNAVNVRLPAELTAHTWTAQTGTNADAAEDKRVDLPTAASKTLTVDQIAYTSYLIQDTVRTMGISDLYTEFLTPMLNPLVREIDSAVLAELVDPASTDINGQAVDVVADDTIGAGEPLDADDIIEAMLQLNIDLAPPSPRFLALSPQHHANLVGTALFHQANTSGWSETLRRAIIGNAFGFDTMMTQNMPTAVDSDTTPISVAFHRNAVALVVRPLAIPSPNLGVSAAVANLDNVSIRITQAYHQLKNGTVVLAEILYGVHLLDARLAKIINP